MSTAVAACPRLCQLHAYGSFSETGFSSRPRAISWNHAILSASSHFALNPFNVFQCGALGVVQVGPEDALGEG